MPWVYVHAHALQEVGLLLLEEAIQSDKWPVEFNVHSRFRRPVPHFAILDSPHANYRLPLESVPFQPLTHRAVCSLPPGTHNYSIIRAQSVIASGFVHVQPLRYPSPVSNPVSRSASLPFALPRYDGVTFTFAEPVPRTSAVHLEIRSSSLHSIPMMRRSNSFSKNLVLPPGVYRYRFRALFQPPLRRVTDIPIARVGWNLADSFRWGIATQWMTVTVPTPLILQPSEGHQRATNPTNHYQQSFNSNASSNLPTEVLHNSPAAAQPTTVTESSSGKSDTSVLIDVVLGEYSSEVSTSEISEDAERFSTFSTTGEMCDSDPPELVKETWAGPSLSPCAPRITGSIGIKNRDSESKSESMPSSSTGLALLPHRESMGNCSRKSTTDSLIKALQRTPNANDDQGVSEISSEPNYVHQQGCQKCSKKLSHAKLKTVKAIDKEEKKKGRRNWKMGLVMISLKAIFQGLMMAITDGDDSQTKARPD